MKTIGVIGAMEEEISFIKQKMDIVTSKTAVGLDFHIGRLFGKNIVLVHCGIGKVNAAICTSVMINQFAADYIINVGVAGAIDNTLNIGDVVVSTDAVQYDVDVTNFNYEPGIIPRMDVSYFVADEDLVRISLEAAEHIDFNRKVVKGRIASGDQFICSKEGKNKIERNHKAACCEMEGAAIAHTAYLNDVPFVIIRSISDKADEVATSNYSEFVLEAAKVSSDLVEKIIELV